MVGVGQILPPAPDPVMPVRVEEDHALTRCPTLTQTPLKHLEHILADFLSLVDEEPTEVEVRQLPWVVKRPEVDDRVVDQGELLLSLIEGLDQFLGAASPVS